MKNLVSVLIALSFTTVCFCQASISKHPATLGIYYSMQHFQTRPATNSLRTLDPGIAISYLKGINRQLDFQLAFNGSFPDSASKLSDGAKTFLPEVDASLRLRFFSPQHSMQPYLLSGIGWAQPNGSAAPYILLGPGAEIRYKQVYFLLNAQYRVSLSKNFNHHFYYGIGVAGLLKKSVRPLKPPVPAQLKPLHGDRDRDGIADSLDKCPDNPGLPGFLGCPDSDGDGIPDTDDKCPQVFGYARYNGCPVPDRDRDGINDEEDHCPDMPGILKYQGCPVPDTDGDGVNDDEDTCITVAGVRENKGCPVIKKEVADKVDVAAQNILFKTGSYDLLPSSFAAISELVEILRQNPQIKLSVQGHTDNVGTPEANQLLSEKRAQTVVEYLQKHGVDAARLSAAGYGQTRPVADNTTAEGKTKNRRVELRVFY